MIEWASVKLAVFDLDGTLYDQRALRLRMAAKLASHSLTAFDLQLPRIIAAYRKQREYLAEEEVEGFEPRLIGKVASAFHRSEAQVTAIIAEWIERRPLPLLKACRFEGVQELFQGLRRSGRAIGVLSDYPAAAKLAKLELEADYIVAAGDPEVMMLKPNPKGLIHIMALAGAAPGQTVMIGDRPERDGVAGRRAGVKPYIRTRKSVDGWDCFSTFEQIAIH
jgi:HAD superfamily hydrolase (TIGR01549 family)